MKTCSICRGGLRPYAERKRENKSYLYYECERCGSLLIDPNVINAMDEGNTLMEYSDEYWNMELEAARSRCFGPCLARLAEVIYYAKIPIDNFVDIGGGTGWLLDALSLYLPEHLSHFYSVEKYPPEERYRTQNSNYRIGSYAQLNLNFQAGICVEVVEHLTPYMLVEMFQDIAAVSSDGAIYLINTGMPEYVKNQDANYLDPFVRGHIVSYSLEGMKWLLEPLGFTVHPIRGKTWAFCIEFHSQWTNEDITSRIWTALPCNLKLLEDQKMGSVLQILGRESVNAYLL